jgi:hypothetical protein
METNLLFTLDVMGLNVSTKTGSHALNEGNESWSERTVTTYENYMT